MAVCQEEGVEIPGAIEMVGNEQENFVGETQEVGGWILSFLWNCWSRIHQGGEEGEEGEEGEGMGDGSGGRDEDTRMRIDFVFTQSPSLIY